MTSLKQLEANRRNALHSTGPKTSEGKIHSRANAYRHGLTAETVVIGVEDIEDYEAFELTITSEYEAETAVARELVLRLASLLWRLRRASRSMRASSRASVSFAVTMRCCPGSSTRIHGPRPHSCVGCPYMSPDRNGCGKQ